MKSWWSTLLVLATIGLTVFACRDVMNCKTCTTHSDSCIFIGSEEKFLCIDKMEAHKFDFDYLSELPSDCDVVYDDYRITTKQDSEPTTAMSVNDSTDLPSYYDHHSFTESTLHKLEQSSTGTTESITFASGIEVHGESSTTPIPDLTIISNVEDRSEYSIPISDTQTELVKCNEANDPSQNNVTKESRSTTTTTEHEKSSYMSTTDYPATSSSPLFKLFYSSTTPASVSPKGSVVNPYIQVKVYPPDLAESKNNSVSVISINDDPSSATEKSFRKAVMELRRRYFSQDGLFRFEIPVGPITCNNEEFKNRRYFVQLEFTLCIIGKRLTKVNKQKRQRQSIKTWQSANPATSFAATCEFLKTYKKICCRF